ncbi:MAG: hypothetical protein ABDK87_03625 [Atribacterota bacterium]
MLFVENGEEIVNPKERVYKAFDEVIFLQDLVDRVLLPLPVVWDAVLSLEKEGKITYFSWQRKTVIIKRR